MVRVKSACKRLRWRLGWRSASVFMASVPLALGVACLGGCGRAPAKAAEPAAEVSAAPPAATSPSFPRKFDYRCKTHVIVRRNYAVVNEHDGKPVILHVDTEAGRWCRDRCVRVANVGRIDGDMIELAFAEAGDLTNTIRITPSDGAYEDDLMVSSLKGDYETDGVCVVRPLTRKP